MEAKKRLRLHQVWFLVSPQNPHKNKSDLEEFALRFEQCQILTAPYPFIRVSDFELKNKTFKTADTLKKLKTQNPNTEFVWLMGSENWENFHKWNDWESILNTVPIASFYRKEKGQINLKSPAITKYKNFRAAENAPLKEAPQWRVIFMKPHEGRATHIRKSLVKGEKPEHLTPTQLENIQNRHSFCVGT